MDTPVKRTLLVLSVLLTVTSCDSFTATDADEEQSFWDKFYGRKSDDEPAAAEPDCDFYGNCKSAKKSGGGWW